MNARDDLAADRAAEWRDADWLRADTECPEPFGLAEAVSCTDSLADWLCGECMGVIPYQGEQRHQQIASHAKRLARDYAEACDLPTPNLLALAAGATSDPKARLVALDELIGRFLMDCFPEAA